MKPTTHICGARTSALPTERIQIARSRSGGIDGVAGGAGRGPSRSSAAPTTAVTKHERPSARRPQAVPPAATMCGSVSEAANPPIGTAVCRIPSASPRSLASNQCMTARPLADWTLAPESPASASSTASAPKLDAWAAASNAAPDPARPTPSTTRSPKRSAAMPHGMSDRTEPASELAISTPTCASESRCSSRRAGASTATPNQIAE